MSKAGQKHSIGGIMRRENWREVEMARAAREAITRLKSICARRACAVGNGRQARRRGDEAGGLVISSVCA